MQNVHSCLRRVDVGIEPNWRDRMPQAASEADTNVCPTSLHTYHDAMAAPNHPDPVMALLRLGERLGYLTYEMLNEMLPHEVVTPAKLDALLMAIDRRHIRL